MATDAKQVLREALQLTEQERADLAAELLSSLPGLDTRNENAWIAEIERRAHAASVGEPGLTWKQTRSRVEKRLPRK